MANIKQKVDLIIEGVRYNKSAFKILAIFTSVHVILFVIAQALL
ncbi:hypothetical protein [Dongshaea marina]|nr:hypothetical protein [Dongshaea marina]